MHAGFFWRPTSCAKAKHEIFSRSKSHLDAAGIVIALTDDSLADDGTALQAGDFQAKKSSEQKIIEIRTDSRRVGESEGTVGINDRVFV